MITEVLTIAMLWGSQKVKEITPSLGEFLSNGYPINEVTISSVNYFGDCPGGREVTLTSEKIMPRNNRSKNQIIQNFY